MSTVVVGTVQSNSTSPPTFKNTSGTEIGTLCRAFVNFNGTGTVAIRASFNVSSITDNGTGDYTVNFTTAMPDANYTVGGITMRGSVNTDNLLFLPLNGTYTSTACRVLCAAPSSSSILLDAVIVNVFFFR